MPMFPQATLESAYEGLVVAGFDVNSFVVLQILR